MQETGYNLRSMRSQNKKLLLRLLADGPLSRKTLAEKAHLTPAAVTKLCAELLADGHIAQEDPALQESRAGRREIPLRLRLEEKRILGVNAETAQITYALCDLAGHCLAQRQTPVTTDPAAVLRTALDFLGAQSMPPASLYAVGICVVGSPKTGSFGLWDPAAMHALFKDAFGVPVAVENNVKAFALSEARGAAEQQNALLFFKWGPGVGSAILSDGALLAGEESGIAEIGHYIVRPGGSPCRCGRRGCLEMEAACAGTPNPATVEMAALALANTATMLDADGILLFGTQFFNPAVADALRAQILRYNPTLQPAAIRIAPHNRQLSYIGPVALCAERFFFG